MRRALVVAIAFLTPVFISEGWLPIPVPVSAAGLTIEVTSTADASPAGGPLCPDATRCTLRKAIETVNADATLDPYTVTFSHVAFSKAAPGTIVVGNAVLPSITRANVTLDASDAGVRIVSGSTSLTTNQNGLVLAGDSTVIRGLAISGFSAACLVVAGQGSTVGGDSALGQGNTIGSCPTGMAVRGANVTVSGNAVGFTPVGDPAPVDAGIAVAASNVLVGRDTGPSGLANRVGNASVGIYVGDDVAPAFVLVRVLRNIVGRAPTGDPAPVGLAIKLAQPSTGTAVTANTIANATTGIAISATTGGISVINNRLQSNTFEAIGGLAIDLNSDGVVNPNDDGDSDQGANGLLNSPVIARAVQSKLTGYAGIGCVGCAVQLYFVEHTPGSARDYATTPLPGGTITAGVGGAFAMDNPPVTPGQWLTATVTDAAGNTSEFGPSTRVGAGAVQCGNTTLATGWNHVGFFGPATVSLSDVFAADPSGHVTAVYHLVDGSLEFDRWFSGSSIGRSLFTVEPGESYWMYADGPVSLAGGFSLSFPLPVQLKAGWNDFVYIGATADLRDALASLGGKYRNLYRFVPDATGGHWAVLGDDTTPAWAREISNVEACASYQLFLDEPVTLVPIQP
jgi:hypothetical protein